MPYCTQAEMERRFGRDELRQLTDRDGVGQIDSEVITSAIADADALIDGYIGNRYTLPLVSKPPLLATVSANIARYMLFEDGRAPETVAQRYRDSVGLLKDISAGRYQLPDAGGAEPAGQGGTASTTPTAYYSIEGYS